MRPPWVSTSPPPPAPPRALSSRVMRSWKAMGNDRPIPAIAEPNPIDVLQGVPGPVPLRRFLRAVSRSGAIARFAKQAEQAVEAFDEFIRESGGTRRKLDAVLSNWQPKSRKQFVLSRRQAAFRAFAELKGVSTRLTSSCIAMHPSKDGTTIDVLRITGEIGISRTSETARVYFGTRRQSKGDTPAAGSLVVETLDGDCALDGIHTARLDARRVLRGRPRSHRDGPVRG